MKKRNGNILICFMIKEKKLINIKIVWKGNIYLFGEDINLYDYYGNYCGILFKSYKFIFNIFRYIIKRFYILF